MKNYLKSFFLKLFNKLDLFKHKIKTMIFTLLDSVEQQLGEWYFIDLDVERPTQGNEKDIFKIPIFTCMRNEKDADSLYTQILKDLLYHQFIPKCTIKKISKTEKDILIKNLELKFTSNDKYYLKTLIYKAIKQKVVNSGVQLLNVEDLTIGNLDSNIDYVKESELSFKIKIIKNQGVPLSQIQDLFVIKIDKSKLYDEFVEKQKGLTGGDIERMKYLNDFKPGDNLKN